MGRCHGPGCRVRTDLDFHSEACQAAWNRQHDEPHGSALARMDAAAASPDEPTVVDEIRAAYIQHTDLPGCGPFRMTRWQRDLCLYDAPDGTVRWRSDDTMLDLAAVRIELVGTVETSTTYRLRCETQFGPHAAEISAVAERDRARGVGVRAWDDMMLALESHNEVCGPGSA